MTITLSRRWIATVLVLIAVAYLVGTSRSSGPAYASGARTSAVSAVSATDTDHISVSATGTVSGTPDTILTSFSVRVTASTLKGAFDSANADMTRVQRALHAKGVATKDLQTSNVSIYSYQSRAHKGAPLVRHFVTSESLTATMRSISKASAQIQAGINAGGSAVTLDDVSLDLKDDSALLTAARKAAFDSAKAKATQYAGLAGRPLGAVTAITETVSNPSNERIFSSLDAAVPAAASIPIQAGSQDVGVTVTVVFALS